ncbi:MAG TPA: TonB-dependent receptor, partial [Fibrella sp.]
ANFQPATPGLFSLGVASLRTRQQTTRLFSSSFGRREDLGILRQPALVDTDLAYLQLSQPLGRRLSLTGQARYQTQKLSINSFFTSLSPGLPVFNVPPERSIESAFLPSLVANYQLNNKTQLRLIASKNSTFFASSIFVPVDSTTSSEEETLFLGLPRNLRTIELDAERYLAPGSFLKLFLFRSTADSTSYDLSTFSNPTTGNGVASSLVSNNVKRSGVGVRFEQRINNNLFGQVLLSANNTTGDITGVAGRGQRLPYHPRYHASIGLNYISAAGNKVGLQINRVGGFFQDRGVAAAVRPTFSPQTYVDLTLAKEPSVRSEVFLKVLNLFDQRQIAFNDVPVGQRRVVAGFTGRF